MAELKQCSFCDKWANEVLGMVERDRIGDVRICNECVSVAIDKLLRPVDAYPNAPANQAIVKAARNVLTSIKSGSPGGIDIDADHLRKALVEYDKA